MPHNPASEPITSNKTTSKVFLAMSLQLNGSLRIQLDKLSQTSKKNNMGTTEFPNTEC